MKAPRARIKTWLVGDFNWGRLCTPRWPFCQRTAPAPPPFYGPYQALGVLTAAIMGLQHALAMAGGLVTPPLLIGMLAPDAATKTYLVQAALLVCGITTFVQVTGVRIPRTPFQWGSGLLSVMGVSFASVPIMTSAINQLMAGGMSFDAALGKMLGTTALCALWPIALSFLPHRVLRRVFPPIVTGTTIFLIGCSLVAVGFKYWGGGAFCADNAEHAPGKISACIIPQKDGSTITASCYNADVVVLCSNNGDVKLPYGSGPYVGMGFLVFSLIILIELFGSPFMRNASLVLALLLGLLISAFVKVDGKRFVNANLINSAPAVTFLWVKRFPLSIFAPAILPLIIVFSITSVETVGDVSATAELSLLATDGPDHVRRIRAGILHDGISGLFSALAGSLPLTTFAQNNGVIALTGVASRWAGWAAAAWLLLFGVIGKVGALVLSIPHCVLGGATSFLFASVITSGIKIIISGDGLNRRNRFITACALTFGLGVTLVPKWAENNLWPSPGPEGSPEVAAVRMAVLLVLETGFCVGAIVAFLLNMLMPQELDPVSVHAGKAFVPPVDTCDEPSAASRSTTDATAVLTAPAPVPPMAACSKDVESGDLGSAEAARRANASVADNKI